MDDRTFIVRAERSFECRQVISQPWNPDAVVTGTSFDQIAGLARSRIRLVRLLPGMVDSLYHSQHCEEEWLFILQGQGVLEIAEEEHLLGPGDFAGFPAPTAPHQLRNPFSRSLLCLMGGSRESVDAVEFPREGKRLLRRGQQLELYDVADAEETAPAALNEQRTRPRGR